jgi:hypothetical protein
MFFALLLTYSSHVFANYACNGAVTYLGIDGNGDIVVSLGNGPGFNKICNINNQGSYRAVPAACKAMYATLLAAKLSARAVTIYYNDDGYTCSTLPVWAPSYGMYFVEGPI